MQLYILRHGDALVQAATDASRPLSAVGEEQARVAGLVLKKFGVSLDVIVCSPLLRAQQTARIVEEIVTAKEFITTEHLAPSSDHHNIFNQLTRLSANAVLCVGHEPHLSTMISLLISGSRNAQIVVQKASLALVDVMPPIASGCGVLQWILQPETMRNLLIR